LFTYKIIKAGFAVNIHIHNLKPVTCIDNLHHFNYVDLNARVYIVYRNTK